MAAQFLLSCFDDFDCGFENFREALPQAQLQQSSYDPSIFL